jgi:hypothetical protein
MKIRIAPSHAAEDSLLLYSTGHLPAPAVPALEEHLLICEHCQSALAVIDEHFRAVAAAARQIHLARHTGRARAARTS